MQISDPAALGKFVTSELSKISNSISLANQQIAATVTLGTAATKNVGVAAGNVVQLDVVTAKLPAVDGSLLTNLPTTALPVALKTDQQTGTSTTLAVTPAHQQDHDGSAKAWVEFDSAGTILASYNVNSVTKNGTGDFDINVGPTSFATANYACIGTAKGSATANGWVQVNRLTAQTASLIRILVLSAVVGVFDPDSCSVVLFGRQ